MATLRELVTELTFKVDKASLKVAESLSKKVDHALGGIAKRASLAEGQVDKLAGRMRGLQNAAMIGGAAILGLGAAFVGTALKTAMAFEDMETVLITTEGSSEKAKKAMDWVSDFAARTPFELAKVTQAFIRMRAYGLDPTNGSLATLGDASAAMGKDVMQAVEMMADAVTGEFERLKEFGIKGNKKGGIASFEFTDKKGIQRTRKVLANDRKAIEKAITDIFSEKYDGAMVRLSGTMGGILSNLKDTWARFLQQVMASGAFEAIKQDLLGILETLNQMSADGRMKAFAEKTGKAILDVYNAFKKTVDFFSKNQGILKTIAVLIGGIAAAYTATTIAMGINSLAWAINTGAITANSLALLANPYGLVAAAIIALGFVIVDVVKNWDSFKASAKDAFHSLPGWIQDSIRWVRDLGASIGDVVLKLVGLDKKSRESKDLAYQAQLAEAGLGKASQGKAQAQGGGNKAVAGKGAGGGSKSFTNTANTTVNINGGNMSQGRAKQLGASFSAGSLSGFRALEAYGI
jgi:hypothetical protein